MLWSISDEMQAHHAAMTTFSILHWGGGSHVLSRLQLVPSLCELWNTQLIKNYSNHSVKIKIGLLKNEGVEGDKCQTLSPKGKWGHDRIANSVIKKILLWSGGTDYPQTFGLVSRFPITHLPAVNLAPLLAPGQHSLSPTKVFHFHTTVPHISNHSSRGDIFVLSLSPPPPQAG